ncbi:MAG: hypothetical protein ACYDDF_09130 [Thermoplasmatota archaeon]
MRWRTIVLFAALTFIVLAPFVAASHTVVVTYELPAPVVSTGASSDVVVAASTNGAGSAVIGTADPDGSIDIGGALNVPTGGSSLVSVTVRDSMGALVQGIVCQDQNHDGSCSQDGADTITPICSGTGSVFINPSLPVNVFVPLPMATTANCPAPQGTTVQGTITMTFS